MMTCTIDRHVTIFFYLASKLAIFTTFLKSTLVVVRMGSFIMPKYYNCQTLDTIVNKNRYPAQERNIE